MITNPIGVWTLSRREIYRFVVVANQTIFPPLISSFLFMYIFGVAMGRVFAVNNLNINYLQFITPGLMALHLMSSSYENTSSSLFIGRWHNHIQEILLAPLSYFEMVLGLLAGGLARGMIVCFGVFLISLAFSPQTIAHPFLLLYFVMTVSVIFSCAGMMGALWAEDFGMLNMWNVYIIVPLIFMGGVFHPLSLLPPIVQHLSHFNPLFYLVQGLRFSVTGVSDVAILPCVALSLTLALATFLSTVYLFKAGYKLRS